MRDFHKAFLFAGLFMFALAFVPMAVLPWKEASKHPMQKLDQIAAEVPDSFRDLERRWPDSFRRHFGEASPASYARALDQGRNAYIADACWHCHTQQVRPVGNERLRFGPVSKAEEYQNELHLPHLLGTRRVGPDLIREAGVHSNDWHAAHLWNPRDVSPTSVMPRYPWFFETGRDGVPAPNGRGLAVIAYLQWLGSWVQP